jgi:hypothetical protein
MGNHKLQQQQAHSPSQEHLQFWEWAPEHLAAVNASNKFDNREGGWSYEVFNSFGLPDFLG